jgi:hypothetical protein
MPSFPGDLFVEGAVSTSGNKEYFCLCCRYGVYIKQHEQQRRARVDQNEDEQTQANALFVHTQFDPQAELQTGKKVAAGSKRVGHLQSHHGIISATDNGMFGAACIEVNRRRGEYTRAHSSNRQATAAPSAKKTLQLTLTNFNSAHNAHTAKHIIEARDAEKRLLRVVASRGEAFLMCEDPFMRDFIADGRPDHKIAIGSAA